MSSNSSKIAIVGAGVFGLSTAIHLRKRGYTDVTVFDYQPYDQNGYDPDDGCDAASADVNKIYRCAYGDEKEYQDLAYSGLPIWQEWNQLISTSRPEDLPKGLTPEDRLLVQCGQLRMSLSEDLSAWDKLCLVELEKAGLRNYQHIIKDPNDLARLERLDAETGSHWLTRIKALSRAGRGDLNGFIDTSAGMTYANKACLWARHLAEKAGVNFILGSEKGKFDDLIYDTSATKGKKVVGLKTKDGVPHHADIVIVACGGWTPSVVPETGLSLETTAGSVITIDLPRERQDLWNKFSPDNFPVWTWGLTGHNSPENGGFYGFPRTEKGKIKIGYRGRKWTNYQTDPKTGKRLSIPKTKYTQDKAVNLPVKAVTYVKQTIQELFPELADLGISDTRLCWYTDSLDNYFLVDYVPGYNDTLFVASGGSGHGFKFLPVLGDHVVNALEKKEDVFTKFWRWRERAHGAEANGLEEGEFGGRNLADLEIATEKDWKWAKQVSVAMGMA